jgi:predicted nucleic acid-binding Zn ribbon protein
MGGYKRKQPTNLTGTLPEIMRDKGWERKLDQHRVFVDWERLVDNEVALRARPLKVVRDVLWLEVENSAWMQQLQFRKIELLETMNEYLQLSRFSDLKFCVEEKKKATRKEKEHKVRFVPPPLEQIEKFEKQVSFIEDERTRDALIRFWYLSQSCQRE